MSKLGELFKSEREKRNLTLHEIGMSLKINPKILKAIEDGDVPNLPAKTFLRGFVKSYAQYFRLDLTEIMQQFQDEYGTTRPEAPLPQMPPSSNQSASTPSIRSEKSLKKAADSALPASTTNKLFPIIGAILLLIMIAFVAKMMDKYQKESEVSKVEVTGSEVSATTTTTLLQGENAVGSDPNAPVTATSDAGAATTSSTLPPVDSILPVTSTTTSTSAPASSTTLKAAAVASTSTTTSTATTAKAVTTTTTLRPTTTTTTTTTTTLKPVTTTTTTTTTVRATTTTTTLRPTPTPTPTASPSPGATAAALTTAAKPTEIIIEALNRVNIRFNLNGQKWESLELNPDQVHTLRSKSPIQIEVSDGGAVNVIVNGRDRGVPGTIGKPLKLSYP